jgi:hypothetical protein
VEDGKRRRVVRAAGKRRRSSGRRRRGIAPDPAATRTFGSKLLSSFFFWSFWLFDNVAIALLMFLRSFPSYDRLQKKGFIRGRILYTASLNPAVVLGANLSASSLYCIILPQEQATTTKLMGHTVDAFSRRGN